MQDVSQIAHEEYIDKAINPCILRAWNNYHGYEKYSLHIGGFTNTRAFFYSLIPTTHRCVVFPTCYFHLFVFNNWVQRIGCDAIFVAKKNHIFCIKKLEGKWKKYDWPDIQTYNMIFDVEYAVRDTRYLILLYPAEKQRTLLECIEEWTPPASAFYLTFRKELLTGLRAAT